MAERRPQPGTVVQERTKTKDKLAPPKRWLVVLHNDDYTTMEFVVWILMQIFHHEETAATQIMLNIHKRGFGVAGEYTREIAESRVTQVETLAREHEFPLRCTMEEA
jgi:ATP-dependent Clp protease adaptor protein ClpS